MKKAITIILLLLFILSGCAENDADENILKNIYAPAADEAAFEDPLIYPSSEHDTAGKDFPANWETAYEEGETVWIVYSEKENNETVYKLGKLENGAVNESWAMPDMIASISERTGEKMIACEDGWLYGWHYITGVFRWQIESEDVIETVMDLTNSGITSQNLFRIRKKPGEDAYSVIYTDLSSEGFVTTLYEPAPDKDLSKMTALTLASQHKNAAAEEAVIRFNQTHDDAHINIIVYDQYNTNTDPLAGYDRFEIDLQTGKLKADILLDEVFRPLDLYQYMTGEIKPEDISGSFRSAYETDGALYSIAPNFYVSTLAGKTSELDGMTSWSLDEFLDFCDSLEDGEYLMEDAGKDNYASEIFGNKLADSFIKNGTADFANELYKRYLDFVSTLPDVGQKYMEHGKNNMSAVAAGEISAEELQAEAAGENLYYNGDIKLYNKTNIYCIRRLTELYNIFGTDEITLIGYPTDEESGLQLNHMGVRMSIPSTCKDPSLAWEFIESILLEAAEELEIETIDEYFTVLSEPYFEYIESMRGYKIFTSYSTGAIVHGWDIELDENGSYHGEEGELYEVDDEMIAFVRTIYDSAGKSDSVPWDIERIITEEESAYLAGAATADICADNVQSRVSIYLSENE